METDLTTEDDAVLDAALTKLLNAHGKATDAGDGAEQAICHAGIMAIIKEQRRRTDAWIEAKAAQSKQVV